MIGGVAAGMSAAAQAKRLDPSCEVVVLEKSPVVSYAACGLPYFVEGRVRELSSLIVHTPEYFRKERNIDVRTNSEVVEIAHSRREVVLSDRTAIHYDKLVLAMGAKLHAQAIEGSDADHVFRLQTLRDAQRIEKFLEERKPRSATIIGAGYIGLEMAEALRVRGLRVSVAQSSGEVLGRDDAKLTGIVAKHLEKFGVEINCSRRIARIDQSCGNMVIISAGFRPNVELALTAEIALGRTGAIAVSDGVETNLSGVYAAGDCAEHFHRVTGAPSWIPLGTTANKMGRIAGANAVGRRNRFAGIVGTSIVRVCGLGIGLTGLSERQARKAGFSPIAAQITHSERAGYFGGDSTTVELVADSQSGKLLGGSVIGEQGVKGRIDVIATALTNGMTVDEFEQLDLAYAPPFAPTWDALLIAAQQLGKLRN